MSLQIIHDIRKGQACFQNTVTEWAFGPVAQGDDADIQLIVFSEWLDIRPEHYHSAHLEREWNRFKREYLAGFKEWMADRWEEIDWTNVGKWASHHRIAQEEAHAPIF